MSYSHEVGDYQTAQTLETFGFLPKLTQDEVFDQIAYLIAQGLTPAIEHEHPVNASHSYWTMWKLPFFGETDLNAVVAEIDACRRAYRLRDLHGGWPCSDLAAPAVLTLNLSIS